MSVNYIDKSTGDLIRVAGQGKAEYGASTVRKGTFTGTDNGTGLINITVTFNTPMPDADYLVAITDVSSLENFWVSVAAKTKNGFALYLRKSTGGSSITVNGTYTAFKLYTDTEYNKVLDDVAALKMVTNGTFTKNATNVSTVASAEVKVVGGSGCLGLVCNLGVEVSAYSEITLGTITIPGFSNVNGQGLGFNQDTGTCSWVFSQNGTVKLAVKGVAVPANSWIYASIPLVGTKT